LQAHTSQRSNQRLTKEPASPSHPNALTKGHCSKNKRQCIDRQKNGQLVTFRYQMTVGAGHPTAFVPLLNKTGIT